MDVYCLRLDYEINVSLLNEIFWWPVAFFKQCGSPQKFLGFLWSQLVK